MDAVLLSGFARYQTEGEKVLDMGTGTGIIPILLKAKDKRRSHLTGLEIQEECADMATTKCISTIDLEADIDIVCGDIKGSC